MSTTVSYSSPMRSPAPRSTMTTTSSSSTSWNSSPSSPDRRQPISVVAGAEGGAEAIAIKRRGSNSFKTMSTGSLVSNSPFTKRLGAVGNTPSASNSPNLSKIPQYGLGNGSPVSKRLSGGRRASAGEEDSSPVKENRNVSGEHAEENGKVIFDGTAADMIPRSRSSSPSVPFRPTRTAPTSNPSATTALASSSMNTGGTPFKPSRPTFGTSKSGSRQESPQVVRGPVSNSPFLARGAKTEETSPPLPQAPYEIAPLSHESAPFAFDQPRTAPAVPARAGATAGSPFSLGHRPGQASLNGGERRFAGATNPLPNTPPHQRSVSTAGSPSPASTRHQRTRSFAASRVEDDGDLTETEGSGGQKSALRRKPSNKTVTWAATEEVLEFEVDERRASGVSNASSMSDDSHYGHQDDDEDDEAEEGNSSMGFEEGGSVEVHDIDSSDDDNESAVSTVDEIIDNIDQFMTEERAFDEFYSPSQIISEGFESRQTKTSADSNSTTASVISSLHSDAFSTASYENEVGHGMDRARAAILSSSPKKESPSPWSSQSPRQAYAAPSSNLDFLGSTLTMDSPGRTTSSSTFALPDIPGTSPFMNFEDDGTAGSVVTLDMQRSAPISKPFSNGTSAEVSRSSPVKRAPGDSPILSAFNRTALPQQQSPQLSRKGSIASDVASNVSYYGSISSGATGPIFIGRDRLDERLSAHQALLSSLSPGSLPIAKFPDSSLSKKPASTGEDREIQARPAPKARSATLSTSMLPTINGSSVMEGLNIAVGSPLTSKVAESMASPLDRLQKGVGRADGNLWRNGDSLLGVSEVARASGSEDEEEEEEKVVRPEIPQGARPTRRRSLSTGDARISETASIVEDRPKKLELGFQRRLADVPEAVGFGMNTQSSLDDIFNSRNHSYRVREAKVVITASDGVHRTAQNKAGDLAASPAVRRKRPSNMHEIHRSLSTVSVASTASRRTKAFRGQLFVHIREVSIEGVPMPRQANTVTFALDNGKQRVEAGRRALEPRIAVKKEFELVCSPDLSFSIDLYVAAPPPAPIPIPQPRLTPPPPASPTKGAGNRLRALLSSPKKKAAAMSRTVSPSPSMPIAITPDPFYSFVGSEGKLASAELKFVDEALKCRYKRGRVTVPFNKDPSRPSNRQCSGSVTLDLFYLPTISGVEKSTLPKSMDETIEGMRLAEYTIGVTHEGVLTQLGGDCSVWRRRNFKLKANKLVPYSEVTKMSHVDIDLSLVERIDDLNVATGTSKYDDDDAMSTMDHSFRLVFKDDTSIDFYADKAESKAKWMKEIIGAASVVPKNVPPQWAILAKRQWAKLQTQP